MEYKENEAFVSKQGKNSVLHVIFIRSSLFLWVGNAVLPPEIQGHI